MVEMLDVLDAAGDATGEVLSRDDVHAKSLWHRGAFVWVVTDAGGILIQRRSENRPTFPGTWDVSAAGHVISGDTPLQTAVKELQEEVGIGAKAEDMKLLGQLKVEFTDPKGRAHREFAWVYLLRKNIDPAAIKLQSSEVMDAKLISLAQLKEDLSDPAQASKYTIDRSRDIYNLLFDNF